MHNIDIHSRYHHAMVEAAKLRASQLHEESRSHFWDETAALALRGLRAADRLAYSLARHARLRVQAGQVQIAE